MRIGIDIDGVLTNDDDYILDHVSKYAYENNIDGIINGYGYEYEKLNWDEDTILKYREKYFYEYVDNEPARRYSGEVINKLRKDGHEIFIITGRYKSFEDSNEGKIMREKIRKFLKNNNIPYDKLIFAEVPKIKELKENKIDIMIEDSPTTIPLINDIVHVFCYDVRYNKDVNVDNMTRVFSWYDIYMKIKNMNK